MGKIESATPEKQIIYINKEDFAFDKIKDYSTLISHVEEQSKNREIAVFIDEIQEIEGFEKALRHLLLKENYDIYCTGSNASMLSNDLATLLSGRSIETEVYALSYTEFLQFHSLEDNLENFQKYLVYGGMPNLIVLPLKMRWFLII